MARDYEPLSYHEADGAAPDEHEASSGRRRLQITFI